MFTQRNRPLKVYLADLVYDTVKTNHVVPLNVAYIAAYVKDKYADDIDITIFKYPKELEESINNSPPDILGLSNYSWNERLDHLFIKMAKRLNPDVLTVMGGPNIRTGHEDIEAYLLADRLLDYYILFEGEEPFANLVERVIGGCNLSPPPLGCAAIVDGQLYYEPLDFKKNPKQIDLPSPYLGGFLDSFLANPNMMPLFETNRGCPFGCTYCAWGNSTHAKVRTMPLEIVYEEMDYVAKKSANRANWYVCDANFGLLKRDVEIAKKIQHIRDEKGYPINIAILHSKNTGERNIEIAEILKDNVGYIAIQSTDLEVLKNCGRGNIKFSHLKDRVGYYKKKNLETATDILIGLPGETAESHLNTLVNAFDLGFEKIQPYNIRMLPGSQYESDEDRKKYRVKTKFRPIFGSYGVYDGKSSFEIEESVRATKDMTEPELESFKLLHWLIYFCWNTGFFKPVLRFAMHHGINPAMLLHKLTFSNHSLLAKLFSEMKKESMAEWFETREEMVLFYQQRKNFDKMTNFVKLSSSWTAKVYQGTDIIPVLLSELLRILKMEISIDGWESKNVWDDLVKTVNNLICKDPLQKEFSIKEKVTSKALSYVLNDPFLLEREKVEIEIYRDKKDISFCNCHLNPDGKKDFSLHNLICFLEMGGLKKLTNRVRLMPV